MKKMKIGKRVYIAIIILILLQSIAITLITNEVIMASINGMEKVNYNYPSAIGFVINILGISVVIWVFYIVKLVEREQEANRKLNHSTEVVQALRGQKHDFHNHLNVISGLIQLEKTKKALDYIEKVCGENTKIFSISNVDNPEVAAILYKKCAIAESKGMSIELGITTDIEGIYIDPVSLCTILFNLIDNAIHELDKPAEQDKVLSIDITEQEGYYIFAVGNSFPILDPDDHEKIFEPGFTTKKGENHGYGLSNVKKIVQRYKGKITLESYPKVGTIFTVFIPKK